MAGKKDEDVTRPTQVAEGSPKATLMDIKNPMTTTQSRQATGRPPEPEQAGINPALMLAAWDKHTKANFKLITTIERNEVDNLETRNEGKTTRVIVAASAAMVMIGLFMGYMAMQELLEQTAATLSASQQTGAQMVSLREQMKAVSDSMASILDVQRAQDELREAVEEPKAAFVTEPIKKKQRALKKKRSVAHVKTIKAQIATAPDAEARQQLEPRLFQAEQQAKKLDAW